MPTPPSAFLEALSLVRAGAADLWPGFDPAGVPALYHDGHTTWLHGATPQEGGWQTIGTLSAWAGLHPALTACTAVTLPGGTRAAGVMGLIADLPAPDLAALLVHEAFHVWQGAHPAAAWDVNELDGLDAPTGDPEVLHARAEEAHALSQALTADRWQQAARAALHWRSRRFAHLNERHVRHETGLERVEGLAHFVETRFLGRLPDLDPLAAPAWPARAWTYRSGAALACLLTRTGRDWPARVQSGDRLDRLLREAVGEPDEAPATHPALLQAARRAAQERDAQLAALLADFHARPGPLLTLDAAGLTVTGFDPMNLHVLPGGRVLHTRFVHLSGPAGHLRVLGGAALTSGGAVMTPERVEVALPGVPSLTGGRLTLTTATHDLDLPAPCARACQRLR